VLLVNLDDANLDGLSVMPNLGLSWRPVDHGPAGVAVICRVVGPARLLPGHNRGRVFTDLAVVLSDGGQRDGDIVPGSAGRRGMPVDVQELRLGR